jgi:hypothetical protein
VISVSRVSFETFGGAFHSATTATRSFLVDMVVGSRQRLRERWVWVLVANFFALPQCKSRIQRSSASRWRLNGVQNVDSLPNDDLSFPRPLSRRAALYRDVQPASSDDTAFSVSKPPCTARNPSRRTNATNGSSGQRHGFIFLPS